MGSTFLQWVQGKVLVEVQESKSLETYRFLLLHIYYLRTDATFLNNIIFRDNLHTVYSHYILFVQEI
jgi:hypothetical protein